MGIEIEGEREVLDAVQSLIDAASDLDPANQAAGQLLLDRADPRTPRRSGRLAASGRVVVAIDETSVVYDEVYAGVIHNGWPAHNITPQPWLADTLAESIDTVVAVYRDHLQDAIDT